MIDKSLKLNTRTRFLNTFKYEPVDHVPDMEFGYWPQTLRKWHKEGLPSWVIDNETADRYFGFEIRKTTAMKIPFRKFEYKVLQEDERTITVRDEDGVVKVIFKDETNLSSIPRYIDFPVKDWNTWEEYKMRFDLNNIEYPDNWDELLDKYKERDYPLGVSAGGFFGWARGLMGLEQLCKSFYREPELIKDMFEFRVEMILKMIGPIVRELKPDFAGWWEDMCWKGGPLISLKHFKEFMVPCYKRITEFLRDHGVWLNIVDSDGNIDLLIPLWLEAGINCFFPCEVRAGSDPILLREKYGREALLMGGVDKMALIAGPKYIDKELDRLRPLIEEGGYIPHVDHRVPPDVSFKNYLYYLKRKRSIIGVST